MSEPLKPVYVTYEDFLETYDDQESSELSMLHLVNSPEIDRLKIERHLALAEKKWLSKFGLSLDNYNPDLAPIQCSANMISCVLAIARYTLDYLNRREDVKEDCESCWIIVEEWREDRLNDVDNSGDTSGDLPIFSAFSG